MTPTGTATYGTEASGRPVIARTRAIPAYLAAAEQQLTAGVAAGNTPTGACCAHGLQTPFADAEYFSKTLPALAATDIASAYRDALLADLHKAGDDAAAAYKHLRTFVPARSLTTPTVRVHPALKEPTALTASRSGRRNTTGRYITTCASIPRRRSCSSKLLPSSWTRASR